MTSTFTIPSSTDPLLSVPTSAHLPLPVPYEFTVAVTIRDVYIWVLLAVGLPCNAACVVTILFMHVNIATFYVALLAVADSLALVVKAIYLKRKVPDAPSCYMLYINNFFSCYANWVLVLIVFQRFYAVCFPLRITGAFTKKRIYISAGVLAAVLFVIVVVPTFYFLEWDAESEWCRWREEIQRYGVNKVWDSWIMSLLYSYLPFLFLVVFTTLIIVGLYRHRRARTLICAAGTSSSSVDGKVECAISIMLVCAGLVFLLLTLPACLFHLFISKLYDLKVRQEKAEWYLIYQVITMLSDASHAVNFFVYFASMRKFRRCFFDLVRCHPCLEGGRAGSSGSGGSTQETTDLVETTSAKVWQRKPGGSSNGPTETEMQML